MLFGGDSYTDSYQLSHSLGGSVLYSFTYIKGGLLCRFLEGMTSFLEHFIIVSNYLAILEFSFLPCSSQFEVLYRLYSTGLEESLMQSGGGSQKGVWWYFFRASKTVSIIHPIKPVTLPSEKSILDVA